MRVRNIPREMDPGRGLVVGLSTANLPVKSRELDLTYPSLQAQPVSVDLQKMELYK